MVLGVDVMAAKPHSPEIRYTPLKKIEQCKGIGRERHLLMEGSANGKGHAHIRQGVAVVGSSLRGGRATVTVCRIWCCAIYGIL